MMTVEEFASSLEGVAREWHDAFVAAIHSFDPNLAIVISYGIPMVKLKKPHFLGFASNKTFFSIHTIDYSLNEIIRSKLPSATWSKATTRIPYTAVEDFETLKKMAIDVIRAHQ